jgi:phosphoglycolate phosphatase-like HAD superfamily hydrolase
MLVSSGSITKTNIVGRIFQELYLGAEQFERAYKQPAVITHSSGYAEHESRVMSEGVLEAVGQKAALGVVSNRPHAEVERSLRAAGLIDHFQVIVARDDMEQAHGQPAQQSQLLLEAARLLKPIPKRSAYVGANIGDVQAAKTANKTVPFLAIGCLAGAPDKDEMQAAFEQYKASMILGHPDHLKELMIG